MSLSRFAYRSATWLSRCAPAWLLRIRPLTVFAIPTLQLATNDDSPAGPPEEVIRWVGSPEEAMLLYGVADAELCAAWHSETRRAAIVIREGAPIACVWVASGEHQDPDAALSVLVSDADRWLFAAVVDPRFRRAGVYQRLLRFIGQQLHAEGVERLVLGVPTDDQAALQAHRTHAPDELGGVLAAVLLGATWRRVSGGLELVTREDAGRTVTAVRVPPGAASATERTPTPLPGTQEEASATQ